MKLRISTKNDKIVFVEGNVFDKNFYRIFNLDVLAPFLKKGFNVQTATYMEMEKNNTCNLNPYIIKGEISKENAQEIIDRHLDEQIANGWKRIAICPISIENLKGCEADEFYMNCIYNWMNTHDKDVENLFIIDMSVKTNITEQKI